MDLIKLTFRDGDIYINAARISAIWAAPTDDGYKTVICTDGDNYHIKESVTDVIALIDALP